MVVTSTPSSSACDLTKLRAICALSFITSPSWPVSVNDGSPSIAHGKAGVSMNKKSPPTPVAANPLPPHAGDSKSRRNARDVGALGDLVVDLDPAKPRPHVGGVDLDRRCRLAGG